MTQNIGAEVRRIVGAVLKRQIEPNEDVTRETDSAWDSLKHIEILFAIEDRFAIRFSAPELAALASTADMTRAVEAKLAS
ncbi:MAG: acyl carrier protein [Acidobacteriaceae bacterium]|nr:acyl carrier protein [Acidobacteriaceae bacterium]